MVKLTAVGLRNYIDKTRARRDAREQAIMDIYSKTGGIGLRRIFGSSPRSMKNIVTDTDNLEKTSEGITKSYLGTPDISTENLAIADDLIQNFGMNPDVVARLAIDPTSFKRLQKAMNDLRKEYADKKDTEMTKEIATTEIGSILEDAIFKQATTGGKLNIPAIEKYVGRELNTLYKTILQEEQLASGAVVFPERVLIETPDPSKIPGFIKSALSTPYNRALQEQGLVRREIAKLTALEKQANLSPFQENEKQWYIERNKNITSAIEEFKKDRFGELAYVYGGSFLQDMLKDYGSFAELAPIQELISLSEDAPPIRIPANIAAGQDEKAFLNYLIQRRILRIGDEFILFNPYTNDILLQDYITE